MTGTAGRGGSGVRCDAAATLEQTERGGIAALGARRAHSDGALGAGRGRRGLGCGCRPLQRARQARRRADRAKPDRQGHAGHQYYARCGERWYSACRSAFCRQRARHSAIFRPAAPRPAICATIARLYAGAAYHSVANHRLCTAEGILPLIWERGEPHGSGLGTVRCVVEHANAWLCSPTSASIAATIDRRASSMPC